MAKNNRNSFSHSVEAWKYEVEVSGGLVLPGGPEGRILSTPASFLLSVPTFLPSLSRSPWFIATGTPSHGFICVSDLPFPCGHWALGLGPTSCTCAKGPVSYQVTCIGAAVSTRTCFGGMFVDSRRTWLVHSDSGRGLVPRHGFCLLGPDREDSFRCGCGRGFFARNGPSSFLGPSS